MEDIKNFKYIIVGAGFFGATMAECISRELEEAVLVLEKRSHIGGNCYSEIDAQTGIECHQYGSHIFHTNVKKVWDYLHRFTSFNHYRHKVLTEYQGRVYQMPINLSTINNFYQLNLKPDEVEEFLKKESQKTNVIEPTNFEERGLFLIGRPLYEAFIKGYTLKQWGTDPKKLPAEILMRIPVRKNYLADYFDDPYQGIPIGGYTEIFNKMLASDKIKVECNVDFFDVRDRVSENATIIYTGPIDRFFNYKFGQLGWRTLTFEKEVFLTLEDFQGTSVMNKADIDVPYTRIHEFKHYHPERAPKKGTVIFREYSKGVTDKNDEPYYPVNTAKDKEILKKYKEESREWPNVIFAGRLGTYTYLDMDDVIHSALTMFEQRIKRGR